MKRRLNSSYDEVRPRVVEALAAEGFGILTEIDIRATLKKKIGVEFRRYEILGACNPALAHGALQTDVDVGVLLPCNVVLYENEDGSTTVSAMDPALAMGAFSDELGGLASEVQSKLGQVLEMIG